MKESGGETALKFNVVKKSVQSSKGMANIHIMYTCVCVCIYIMWVFSFSLSTGCILGVGLVLSLMSYSSQTESRVHVSASLRKLCKYLENSEDQSRSVQEV